ncbi:MAG: diaminopimelate epimerase [Blautia sp.]|nr:diaminopimelate epimerase [Blautia sp.]
MKFTKMHGIGNDYVYVDCFQETVENPSRTAIEISDRHFGIGSDGLILIKPTDQADCEMEMYNADGSSGAMCGNGVRCVAKYAYDHGIVHKPTLSVLTGSGIKKIDLTIENGKAVMATVNMGSPILEAKYIPVISSWFSKKEDARIINAPLEVDGQVFEITAVSMGNPHAVIFVDRVKDLALPVIGPKFEHHPAFPDRVNTEFVEVLDSHTVRMRVWERGSGETLACGTGACAVAVACILNGKTDSSKPITVKLLGGDLQIEWNQEQNQVFMTGPATEVFHGEI